MKIKVKAIFSVVTNFLGISSCKKLQWMAPAGPATNEVTLGRATCQIFMQLNYLMDWYSYGRFASVVLSLPEKAVAKCRT